MRFKKFFDVLFGMGIARPVHERAGTTRVRDKTGIGEIMLDQPPATEHPEISRRKSTSVGVHRVVESLRSARSEMGPKHCLQTRLKLNLGFRGSTALTVQAERGPAPRQIIARQQSSARTVSRLLYGRRQRDRPIPHSSRPTRLMRFAQWTTTRLSTSADSPNRCTLPRERRTARQSPGITR